MMRPIDESRLESDVQYRVDLRNLLAGPYAAKMAQFLDRVGQRMGDWIPSGLQSRAGVSSL